MTLSIIVPTHNRLPKLKRLLESLLRQGLNHNTYEVIIVNDGSLDGTRAYLESISHEKKLRCVTIDSSGPTIARNRGAELAQGEILVFTDDDCIVPRSWLSNILSALRREGAAAVGGSVRNLTLDNSLAVVYDQMNRFFAERFNTEPGRAFFLTTNNFACTRSAYQESGGFDERFYHGAEDREFVARLIAGGHKVCYVPEIVVDHFHSFSLRSFLFHLFRQGRGSYVYYNVAGKEKNLGLSRRPLRDYWRLIGSVSKGSGVFQGLKRGVIALLGQAFVLLGYLSATWEGVTNLQGEGTERGRAAFSGHMGTMFGMVSFLGGNIFSSAFGFLSFLIIGNVLSLSQFGVFMVAFSLEAILSNIAGLGLHTSVTRYASEFSKKGDEGGAATILKSGLLLQLVLSFFVGLIIFLSFDLLNEKLISVELPNQLLFAVLIGMCGTVVYNYLVSVYSIYLRFLDLALLRSIVSIIRVTFITIVALLGIANPVNLFWAFILPTWVGLTIASRVFYRDVKGKGKIREANLRKILTYGGWQTVTSISRMLTAHLGPLLLAAYATEKEVGTFGLGLSLSFIYAVIATTIGSYFMPIGARIKSEEHIVPFVRRTLRLGLPVAIVSLLSLAFSNVFVRMLYGEAKLVALPVFVLLSLPIVIRMAFSGIPVLFHYFFKPYYISYESLARLGLFLLASLYFSQFGAIAVAAVLSVTGILALAFSFLLLSLELNRIGMKLQPRLWGTFGFSRKD